VLTTGESPCTLAEPRRPRRPVGARVRSRPRPRHRVCADDSAPASLSCCSVAPRAPVTGRPGTLRRPTQPPRCSWWSRIITGTTW
jgi:hypothetical protein